jgi:hypothetical protein
VLGRRLGFLVDPALAVVIRRPAGQDRPGYVACWN